MKASGSVLVGGKSRRMGVDKPALLIGGEPLIARVVGALSKVVDEVVLVGNDASRFAWLGVDCVADLIPNGGPLVGIYTALTVARHPFSLIVACDMPFIQPALLAYLLERALGWDAVVPLVDGRLEPLHAVYARSCLPAIEEMIRHREWCPLDLYPRVRVRYVEEAEIAVFEGGWRSFVNLNTPEDLVVAHTLEEPEKCPIR